jgi:AcrR family transcriptional regulator
MLTMFTTVKGVRAVPTPNGPTRRERVRDATVLEIKGTARRLLVEDGPEALTLRAIAREMGMTPAALYRYFPSHDEIVAALCQDVLDEITRTLERARDAVAADDPVGRLMAACREFRRWSLAHPREFQLTYAGAADRPPVGHEEPGQYLSFGAVFLGIFVEIWAARPFPVPDDADLPPDLTRQLRAFAAASATPLPLGVLAAYLAGWVRLYGAVTIEVFGHLGFALTDAEPMFEAMLADMRRQLTAPA